MRRFILLSMFVTIAFFVICKFVFYQIDEYIRNIPECKSIIEAWKNPDAFHYPMPTQCIPRPSYTYFIMIPIHIFCSSLAYYFAGKKK